jgi:hypothetical protein
MSRQGSLNACLIAFPISKPSSTVLIVQLVCHSSRPRETKSINA